jgi:ABC-type molybdenum transport system ATPase subunit/photorepair protein PhrA
VKWIAHLTNLTTKVALIDRCAFLGTAPGAAAPWWQAASPPLQAEVLMTSRAYRQSLNGSALAAGEPQLEVRGVRLCFGGVKALDDVTLLVRQGEVHAVVGPNGAGKTSLLNCISGLYRPAGARNLATATRPARIRGSSRRADRV